ncbi:hypothetical protein BDN71DRAFT_1435631 [Pleurotus eryngii]|uniref:Uncharacterized protein n=1 Tax=Pleurotus eryngii TaxID=5323 RepID=A0A9P5ZNQ2_PLEER|nr:hypothetical protein BDN71DRAFT_1435631 [Pleurotus eryngii]
MKDTLRVDRIDFLCPYSGRKFVGITEEPDISLNNTISDATAIDEEPTDAQSANTESDKSNKVAHMNSSRQHSMVLTLLALDSVKDELADNDVHLEDYIGDKFDQHGELMTFKNIPADWLDIPTGNGSETKLIHKASMLACLFKSGVMKLSANRLSWICGYTKDFKHREDEESSIEEAVLWVKDIVVSVVQTGDKMITPVLVVVSSIFKHGKMVMATNLDEMHSSKATGIHITGQVLVADHVCNVGNGTSLVWNGGYSHFIPLQARKQVSASAPGTGPTNSFKNSHLVNFPSHLVFPLNEGLISTDKLPSSLTKANLEHLSRRNTSYITLANFDDLITTEFEMLPLSAYQKLKNMGVAPGIPLMDSAGVQPLVTARLNITNGGLPIIGLI